jgi:hypothetical protein
VHPNEPKKPPFTRTLPAIDVVVESDPPPSGRSAAFSASDIDALRRGVRRVTEQGSDPPASRPSLPVRAARGAKSKSPWIVVGIVLAELIQHLFSKL